MVDTDILSVDDDKDTCASPGPSVGSGSPVARERPPARDPVGGRLVRTVRGAVAPAWGLTVRLAGHVTGRWRRRSRGRAFEEALVALGERMYAAGIDDGHLGAQIAAVGQHVRQGHPAGVEVEGLQAARRKLLVRLAAAALEEDAPLPGADAEYETARKARAALANRDGRGSPQAKRTASVSGIRGSTTTTSSR
jgi:hypothetical protein